MLLIKISLNPRPLRIEKIEAFFAIPWARMVSYALYLSVYVNISIDNALKISQTCNHVYLDDLPQVTDYNMALAMKAAAESGPTHQV